MKFSHLLAAAFCLLFASSTFAAGFGNSITQVTQRGFFGVPRNTITSINAGGASITNVEQRRGFFGLQRNQITSVNGGGANVSIVNQRRGLFGLRNNTNVINVNNRAQFVPAAKVRFVNGYNLGSFQTSRINAFGTTTFTDQFGNIYEADAFGNTAFRGSAFGRGFGYGGYSAVSRSFAVPLAAPCYGGCASSFSVSSYGCH